MISVSKECLDENYTREREDLSAQHKYQVYNLMIVFKKKTSDLLQPSFSDPIEMPSRDQVDYLWKQDGILDGDNDILNLYVTFCQLSPSTSCCFLWALCSVPGYTPHQELPNILNSFPSCFTHTWIPCFGCPFSSEDCKPLLLLFLNWLRQSLESILIWNRDSGFFPKPFELFLLQIPWFLTMQIHHLELEPPSTGTRMLRDGCPRKLLASCMSNSIQVWFDLQTRNQGIWPNFDISNFNEMTRYQPNSGPSWLIIHREKTTALLKIAEIIMIGRAKPLHVRNLSREVARLRSHS